MVGTTGLEPAASAVTAIGDVIVYRGVYRASKDFDPILEDFYKTAPEPTVISGLPVT